MYDEVAPPSIKMVVWSGKSLLLLELPSPEKTATHKRQYNLHLPYKERVLGAFRSVLVDLRMWRSTCAEYVSHVDWAQALDRL